MTVTICRSLAALKLGFLSCSLRTVQQSAWSQWDEDQMPVSPTLQQFSRLLLAVQQGIDALQWSLFDEFRGAVESGHEQALSFRDALLAELAAETGDAEAAYRQLPGRIQARTADCQDEQEDDWEALTLLTLKAIEHDPQLTAWWELGFTIANLTLRPNTKKSLVAHHGEADAGLPWAVNKLSEAEQTWLKEILPSSFRPGVDDVFLLLSAYDKLRAGLPEMDRQRGRSSIERRFKHNQDFSKCWWLPIGDFENDDTERVVIQRLFEDIEQRGNGVKTEDLLDGTGRSLVTRLDAVFLHGSRENRRYNPAWEHGLIENVHGWGYRMNLHGHARTRKNTSPRTDQE